MSPRVATFRQTLARRSILGVGVCLGGGTPEHITAMSAHFPR